MEILNAVITKVAVAMNNENYLSVSVIFKTNTGSYEWNKRLADAAVAGCLERLMRYATANNFEEMEGKIVRVVIHNDTLYGFGDPMRDGFVPIFKEDCSWQVTPTTFSDWLNEFLKNE